MQMVSLIFWCKLLKIQLDEIRNGKLDDSYVWLEVVLAQVTGTHPAVSLEIGTTALMTSQDRFYLRCSAL